MSKITKIGIVGPRPYFIGGHDPDNDIRTFIRLSITEILDKLVLNKTLLGLTGLNIGVEQDFASVCYNMGVDYCVYLPYNEQEDRWKYLPPETTIEYNFLLSKALKQEIISEGSYSPHKNLLKIYRIIADADEIIWIRNKKVTMINSEIDKLINLSQKVVHAINV